MTQPIASCPSCGTRNRLPVVSSGRPRCAKCQADLPWLVEANGVEFDDAVARSSLPVLVDLWAPWCGPCRMVAPALEELAVERAGSLRIVKVNVDEAPQVSERYGVRGIPTMLLLRDGEEVARQVGALPLHGIREFVDSA